VSRLRRAFAALLTLVGHACSGFFESSATKTPQAAMTTLHSIPVKTLAGVPADLGAYEGQVLLVVNTASTCGFTPQYAGLEALWQQRKGLGLVVLGFPSNDFGGQEPGDAGEIADFCATSFGVSFPLFEKVVTKAGPGQSPVYAYLGGATGTLPGWNFGKYLVGKDGRPLGFYASTIKPDDKRLLAAIDAALAAP
jgi:glutathione peroxidase